MLSLVSRLGLDADIFYVIFISLSMALVGVVVPPYVCVYLPSLTFPLQFIVGQFLPSSFFALELLHEALER